MTRGGTRERERNHVDPEKKKNNTPRMTQDTDMHEHRPLRYQLCKLVRDKGESKDSCRERCALQWRQLSASSFRKQLLSNPDIGVWGQELPTRWQEAANHL